MASVIFSIATLFLSHVAFAHPQDMGSLDVKVITNKIIFTLELSPEVAQGVSGLKNPTEKPNQFLNSTLGRFNLFASGHSCDWKSPQVTLNGLRVRLKAVSVCAAPVKSWKLSLPFMEQVPRGFELLIKIAEGPETREFVANASDKEIEYSPAKKKHSWSEFIGMGVSHIGATPGEWTGPNGLHFPDGIDHILFVIALALGGGGFLGVLKTVTGFTLGHSITLALATLGIVHIPARLVESSIALSIAFVAAESIFYKNSKTRWKIAMTFGLVHGLGFASALSELHLSRESLMKALLGFNVGVEFGQAIIVAATLPLILVLQNLPVTRRFAIPTFATGIFLAGSFWFMQRAFGS